MHSRPVMDKFRDGVNQAADLAPGAAGSTRREGDATLCRAMSLFLDSFCESVLFCRYCVRSHYTITRSADLARSSSAARPPPTTAPPCSLPFAMPALDILNTKRTRLDMLVFTGATRVSTHQTKPNRI